MGVVISFQWEVQKGPKLQLSKKEKEIIQSTWEYAKAVDGELELYCKLLREIFKRSSHIRQVYQLSRHWDANDQRSDHIKLIHQAKSFGQFFDALICANNLDAKLCAKACVATGNTHLRLRRAGLDAEHFDISCDEVAMFFFRYPLSVYEATDIYNAWHIFTAQVAFIIRHTYLKGLDKIKEHLEQKTLMAGPPSESTYVEEEVPESMISGSGVKEESVKEDDPETANDEK